MEVCQERQNLTELVYTPFDSLGYDIFFLKYVFTVMHALLPSMSQ